jgi:hypothetical protein
MATTPRFREIGGSSTLVKVKVASTTSGLSHSGIPTNIDGITSFIAGDLVLDKNASTPENRKVYVIASGTWSAYKIPQPDFVGVMSGTVNQRIIFMLTAANTYSGNRGQYA